MLLELIANTKSLKPGAHYKFFELAPDNELNAFLFDPSASLPYINERDNNEESEKSGVFDRPDDRLIVNKNWALNKVSFK